MPRRRRLNQAEEDMLLSARAVLLLEEHYRQVPVLAPTTTELKLARGIVTLLDHHLPAPRRTT